MRAQARTEWGRGRGRAVTVTGIPSATTLIARGSGTAASNAARPIARARDGGPASTGTVPRDWRQARRAGRGPGGPPRPRCAVPTS